MFKSELEEKLKSIFGISKVSFSAAGESKEQECLFVKIENATNNIKDGQAVSKVTGNAVLFGNGDKLPFGFFSKKIKQAGLTLTKDLYFYDFEANETLYQNIVQRGFSFIYFYRGQYDPEVGEITSINVSVSEEQ